MNQNGMIIARDLAIFLWVSWPQQPWSCKRKCFYSQRKWCFGCRLLTSWSGSIGWNTSTEEFIAINQNMGELEYIDLLGLIDLSEKYVRQHLNNIHRQPLDLICGLVGFHSSYMPKIQKYASEYNVDPRLIIIELCSITRSSAPDDVLKICESQSQNRKQDPLKYQRYLSLYSKRTALTFF